MKLFESKKVDLIVLDIMIPYIDGFEIARRVRKKDPQMPILMLTARTTREDKVKGLELGADDYITKPFHLDELLLRVKGMLKRKTWYKDVTSDKPLVSFGDNKINFENLGCSNAKNDFKLTPQEAMVMKYLIENKGKIVSRKELLENVWHLILKLIPQSPFLLRAYAVPVICLKIKETSNPGLTILVMHTEYQ